jgi:imidazolonepropionase-like amidohydrolase
MHTFIRSIALLALTAAPALTQVASAQVAIKAESLYTMSDKDGGLIKGGVVVIRDGKIAAVGPEATTPIPAGFRVLSAKVATPGLVDAHATVGLTGLYNSKHDSDQLERSTPVQPELRAVDAYNPQEKLVEWVRSFGITTVHTGHAPGGLVSGQTMVVKTAGRTVDEALVKSPAMVAATLGPESMRKPPDPGTRAKQIALLREELIKAGEYRGKRAKQKAEVAAGVAKDEPAERNLRMEMLVDVLDGRVPLLVTAHRVQDLASVLRLAEEFKIRVVLDGASEAYVIADRIKAAGVPVVLHPAMQRAFQTTENASFETAAKLRDAGVLFATQSGYEDYVPKVRVVLYEAAVYAANGLTFAEALATVTTDAAKIIGVDDRVGSLVVGKDGDIALYDADPFEYTSHCVGVVIEGKVVSDTIR